MTNDEQISVPEQELLRRAQALARPHAQRQAPTNALLLRVADERYAVALNELALIQPAALTPVPLTAPFVAGLLNVRGVLTTVLRADVLLGLGTRADRSGTVLISRYEGQQVGLLVDEVLGLMAAEPEAWAPSLSGSRAVSHLSSEGVGWIDLHILYSSLPSAWADHRSKP